jgi:hypothetical protein
MSERSIISGILNFYRPQFSIHRTAAEENPIENVAIKSCVNEAYS